VNPSGHLPITFYRSTADLPAFTDYSMANRTYRYFSGKPLYAFGHGLSYTRFSYTDLRINAATLQAGVTVSVRNTGRIAGAEVVQLYLSQPAIKGAPLHSLKGYERVELAPGQTQTVHFNLSARDLALAGDDGRMRINPAQYQLWIGGGQPDTGAPGLRGQFEVSGTQVLEP